MLRYEQVSGALFTLVALAQLTRAMLGWRVQIADVAVPVWASIIAFLITGAMAAWAFRTGRRAA